MRRNITLHSIRVSNAEMEQVVNEVYEQFDARRKAYDAMLADEEDTKLLEEIIEKTKEL